MNKNNVVSFQGRERIVNPLNDLLRTGARKLIEQAIEAQLPRIALPIHKTADNRNSAYNLKTSKCNSHTLQRH